MADARAAAIALIAHDLEDEHVSASQAMFRAEAIIDTVMEVFSEKKLLAR